jgi:hypothetical protein
MQQPTSTGSKIPVMNEKAFTASCISPPENLRVGTLTARPNLAKPLGNSPSDGEDFLSRWPIRCSFPADHVSLGHRSQPHHRTDMPVPSGRPLGED